jgi:hypothetical protein
VGRIGEEEREDQVIEQQMTQIYVFVDDYLKSHEKIAIWRQSPNSRPEFSDSEVLTIAIMQGCFGVDSLKQAYDKVAENYLAAFPHLCSYKQWIARLHKLDFLTGKIFEAISFAGRDSLYLADSKPIPVCHPIRHGRVRLLRDDGAYWGKTSKGWFFGFKLHTIYDINGCVISAILTPGNVDDRDCLLPLALSVDGGILIVDLGYKGEDAAISVAEDADILLIRRTDAPNQRELISSVRQRIETLFSQLCRNFIDKVFSRSWLGLWNTIKLKLIHYNLLKLGFLSA